MPNEFIIKNGYRSQGNSEVTGSVNISGSLSIIGAQQSAGDNNVLTYNTSTGLVTYTSSAAIGGGGNASDFPYTGSAIISGSLSVTGSISATAGVTASLQGTASWAQNAVTASYVLNAVSASFATTAQTANTASYVLNAVSSSFSQTASFVTTAQTASYVLNAVSSSFSTTAQTANTASFVTLAQTASFITTAQTASFITTAQTASYILNAVSASFANTAQTANTASFVTLAQTASFVTTAQTASYVLNAVSASFARTASFVTTAQTASFVTTAQTASYVLNAVSSSFSSTAQNANTASFVTLAQTASYVLNAVSASRATSASRADSAVTASYVLNAVSASFASTASFVNTLNQNVTVSGSLTVTNDFTVLGSASIVFITSSQLNISDNIISVNTISPSVRFGGLAVIDSGSTPERSGSLLFDSENNQWIFVHQNTAGGAVTSSVLLMGPQTFNNVGGETTITVNRLTKGTGADLGEHLGDSNITDTGTLVSINSNTQITGSLTLGGGATGSLQGTASWAVSASNVAATSNAFIQGGNSFGTTATLGTNDTQNLNIETAGSTRIFISSSGQVGIGTTSPREQLGIAGGGMRIETAANSEASTIRQTSFHSTLYLASNLYYSGSTAPESNSYYILDSGSNLRGGNLFYIKTNGAPNSSGFFFYTAPTSSGANTLATLTENFRITPGTASFSNNLVGIGVTAPTAKLHVNNTGNDNSFLVEDAANPDSTPFVIDNAGRVGIGTLTPGEKVVIRDGNVFIWGETSGNVGLRLQSGSGTSFWVNTPTASFMSIGGNGPSAPNNGAINITTAGNIGIGTTLPTSSLHVVGPTAGETITADNNDFGTIIRSRNTSGTGTPRQFYVTHNLADVDLGNLRGNINITTGSVGINTNATQTAFAKFVVRAATNNLFGFASVSSTASIIAWDDTGVSNTLRLAGNPLIFTGDGGSGAEHMRLNSSGELGIGLTPATGFRVAANGTIGSFAPAGSITGSIYIDHTGVQSWKIGVSASSTSTLSIGNDLGGAFVNKILNLTNAGNVGIRTTTPTQGTLQVNGNVFATSFTGSITGSVTGALTGTASFATSASFLTSNTNAFIQGGNSFGTTATLGTNDAQGLNIETAGATRISVSGSGEVGIGLSANANGQLFVLTSTKTYGIAANNTSNNGTGIIGQVGPSGGTGTVIGVHGLSNSSVATNNIGLFGQALNGTNNYAIRLQDGSEGIGKVLVAQTANGDGKWGTQLTGNYEITGSLIVSASGTTNDLRVGTNKLFVSASSNVGIGTAAPNARLHVSGGAETIRIETSASIGSGPYMTFYGNNTIRGYVGYGASTTNQLLLMNQASGANDSLNLGTNSLIRLTVSSSGEVGIGTSYTSPSSLLSVLAPFESNAFDITNAAETPFKYRIINSGSATINGVSFKSGLYYNNLENATINFWRGGSTTGGFLTFNTNNGTERMRIDSSGNVGIGNTNPPNTLSVSNAGATAVTATTYALAVQRSNVTDITLGSDASFSYLQSWQSKPLLLNSLGNNIGINKTTTPNAQLDVNGNTIITGSLSVTTVVNGTGSFVTIDANNTLKDRTAAEVRVDINYYGLTYAMQNGYY